MMEWEKKKRLQTKKTLFFQQNFEKSKTIVLFLRKHILFFPMQTKKNEHFLIFF